MVQIDVVRSCISTLVKTQPLVAVFVGVTAGIGEYAVRALAATHSDQGKGLHVYLVGRKADAAEKTIADCLRLCPMGQFRFVQAKDLALLKDVDRVCAEITRIEEDENVNGGPARVDLLVMTQAYLTFEPRRGISPCLFPLFPSLHQQAFLSNDIVMENGQKRKKGWTRFSHCFITHGCASSRSFSLCFLHLRCLHTSSRSTLPAWKVNSIPRIFPSATLIITPFQT